MKCGRRWNSRVAPKVRSLLLIDDDDAVRDVLAVVLGYHGFDVRTADCGEAGLAMLQENQAIVDAVLLDAQMPGLSGLALIRSLRATTRARLILMSASYPEEAWIAAADAFLLKPFAPEELLALLDATREISPSTARDSEEDEVLSAAALARMRTMMPESAIREILVALVADLETRAHALDAAIANNDAAEVRRLGHAIKGGCAVAGAAQAARIGARIEAGAHRIKNSAGIEELREATAALRRMLERDFPAV